MQVIESLRLAADEAFRRALATVSSIDSKRSEIDRLNGLVRNGGADALRTRARVMDMEADVQDELDGFKSWVAERVRTPLETLDRVAVLDLEKVPDHLARVLPHIDLREDEVRKLVDAALDADDYASFRFVASCSRMRGMPVSDPFEKFRKDVEHVLDEISGFSASVVADAAQKGGKGGGAYIDNVGALLERVKKDIDAAERGIHSITIGEVTRVVPAPRPTVEEVTAD